MGLIFSVTVAAFAMAAVAAQVATDCGGTGETASAEAQSCIGPENLQLVLEDAASRAAVDPMTAQVILAEQQTWPDTSLGCPEPDHSYFQVVTPGWLVQVDAGGSIFEYHLRDSTRGSPIFVLCADANPAADAEPTPSAELNGAWPAKPATVAARRRARSRQDWWALRSR